MTFIRLYRLSSFDGITLAIGIGVQAIGGIPLVRSRVRSKVA